MFQWLDYEGKFAELVDSWLDKQAVDLTGLEDGWHNYWLAVKEDAVNYPGCMDFCKIVCEDSVPFAAVSFGIYLDTMTISEIVVDPKLRGMGKGSALLTELVEAVRNNGPNVVKKITAVVFPQNLASQTAFRNAGFLPAGKTEDGVDLIFTIQL